MSAQILSRPARIPAGDLRPEIRTLLAVGAALVTQPMLWALARVLTGHAPEQAALREIALAIHLVAVVPALPLGAYVLLTRKGGARHRLLGKIWLVLMIVGALSAWWIRHLNDGGLSFVHLFVPLVLVSAWRAVAAARRGDIARHKGVLVGMFAGALVVPGLFALLPGRLLWTWMVG